MTLSPQGVGRQRRNEEGAIRCMVRKRYGVPTAFGLPGRVTYVIDRQGVVRHIFFSQFTSEKHVTQALSTLQSIREEHI